MFETSQPQPPQQSEPRVAPVPPPAPESALRLRDHLGPLAFLALVHGLVFARSLLRNETGFIGYYVPWDFEFTYHRLLVYLSDAWRAGALPIWNPYFGGGAPLLMDPQSQMWWPLNWLVGGLFGYTHDVAQRQLFGLVLLGGVGAYALSYELWRSRLAGLFTALCFSLSMATLSNLEHMDIIQADIHLPWIFFFLARTTRTDRAFPALALTLYSFIVSGYVAIVFMTLLWVGAGGIYLAWSQRADALGRMRHLGKGVAACALALALSCSYWLPVVNNMDAFTRGSAMSTEAALWASLKFRDLLGLVFGFASAVSFEPTEVDGSMRGVYVGVIALPLAGIALVRAHQPHLRAIFALTVGCLLMSLGSSFFPRVALQHMFTFFNLSRFPAVDSRALMSLGLAALVGGGVVLLRQQREWAVRVLQRSYFGLFAIFSLSMLPGRHKLLAPLISSAQYHDIVLNGMTAAAFVLFVAWIASLRNAHAPQALASGLLVLLALDLGSQINAVYGTHLGHATTPGLGEQRRTEHVSDFTVESALAPRIVTNAEQGFVDINVYRGLTAKRFYAATWGGFRLHRLDSLVERGFLPWLGEGPRMVGLPVGAQVNDYAEFTGLARPVDFKLIEYLPDSVSYRVQLPEPTLLALNEVYFPGWRAEVDGQHAEVQELSGGLRAIQVPAGTHAIYTVFRPRVLYVGLGVTVTAALATLAWLAVSGPRRRRLA